MRLKEIRIQARKTQQQVADALKISQPTYNNYENEKTQPDFETVKKLANYFHTTTDAILGHEVPYLLDKSTLTPEQREIVEIVPQMNYEECKLMLAYLAGVKQGIKERNGNFNFQNKEE